MIDFDDDDYETDGCPSPADLRTLATMSVWGADGRYDRKKLEEWLHFAAGIWCACGSCSVIGDVGTFATGGWSGNEDIIASMQENLAAWLALWESTHRGGKFIFSMRDA